MQKKWLHYPLFVLLLPLFFIFHGYVENYYFLSWVDCLPLLGIYITGALIVFLLAFLFMREKMKAALLTGWLLSLYFFFGALHDFLRKQDLFLNRYTILLPTLLLSTFLVTWYIKKRKPFRRLPVFLNTLLLLYIFFDGFILLKKNLEKRKPAAADNATLLSSAIRCDTCVRPDIYLLVFDEYTNSKTLKDVYRYDNSAFDSFLVAEHFQIQHTSHSNYGATFFSMASMLNYSYLDGMEGITFRSYKDMLDAIATNKVVNFLFARGYTVVNNSPFDLPGNPTVRELPFIPVKGRLISNRTMLNYIVRDMEKSMKTLLLGEAAFDAGEEAKADKLNTYELAQTKIMSGIHSDRPRFLYTHLMMPHPPYLYDSLLRRRSPKDIIAHLDEAHPDYYLSYIPFTNTCARDLITTIKKNTAGKAVIIFMSDHGFRYMPENKMTPYFFDNQNAIYLPDGDYRSFYDSISNVNEFRVLFNKLFRQEMPILKDSSIYLIDKEL
jgi:hypothetical protein